MASSDRGFASFFRGLPGGTGPRRVRFFSRDGGSYFTCHGEDARELAKSYYSTTSVVRVLAGLPSLAISFNMLTSKILSGLLAANSVIEIWETGARDQWRLVKQGSPGDPSALEELMLSNSASPDAASVLGTAVMMAVVVKSVIGKSPTLGVAYVNSSFHTLGLTELEDTNDFTQLEALTVQIGARECLLPEQADGTSGLLDEIEDVMKRCHVLCSSKKRDSYKGGTSVLDQLRALITSEEAQASLAKAWESEGTTTLEQAGELKLALQALGCLISHLGLPADSRGGEGTYTLSIVQLHENLHFDASASRALSVLPEATASHSRLVEDDRDGGGDADEKEVARGSQQLSLFSILNRCKTPAGSRQLKRWLLHPLIGCKDIESRQSMVSTLVNDRALAGALTDNFGGGLTGTGRGSFAKTTPDLERIAQKFLSSKSKTRAGLRDLLECYVATLTLARIRDTLNTSLPEGACPAIDQTIRTPIAKTVAAFSNYQALVEEVVDIDRILATQGRQVAVKAAFDDDLLRLRGRLDETRQQMEDEAKRVAKKIKLDATRVKLEYSQVHQHHMRVTKKDQGLLRKAQAEKGPDALQWQTVSLQKPGLLFSTPELRRLSQIWETVSKDYEKIQDSIVSQAVEVARTYSRVMQQGGRLLAEVDALLSLSNVAANLGWSQPKLLGDSVEQPILTAQGLQHPVVEAALSSGAYIPNDLSLDGLTICTGPNMGGKSTYIRSAGIAVLLAQMGSHVPADSFEWTIVDRILCRVGASDNQIRGVSTFAAEMLETRSILHAATRRSLVIIDELGRGTSTFDGFGIAWAVANRLACSVGCRTLFATHFHELTELEAVLPSCNIENVHFTAETRNNKLTLLYQVRPGPSDRSFGVHVASIAKFPVAIVEDAQRRVDELEAESRRRGRASVAAPDGTDGDGRKRRRVEEDEDSEQTEGDGDGATAPEETVPSPMKKRTRRHKAEDKAKVEALKAFMELPIDDSPLDRAVDAVRQLVQQQ